MREDVLKYFVCSFCHGSVLLESVIERRGDEIKEGSLVCNTEKHRFQLTRFIPRFVSTHDLTSSFGFEWNKHPRTQFDSFNGMRLSEKRFFQETGWPADLSSETILEVGSGAGRFTEIALKTGARVFSVDASQAVDANWMNNGENARLILSQASLYELPFRESFFDKVFCFGVLQHTPDVRLAFSRIARLVKPGGDLVVDVYNKAYWRNYHTPMYLIRPLTKRISHETLYRWVSVWVPRLLPVSSWFREHIPFIGHKVAALIPVSNYTGLLPTTSKELIEQYSILDTFDTLSPQFISPQREETVRQWFVTAGFEVTWSDHAATFAMRGRKKLEVEESRASEIRFGKSAGIGANS